MFLTILLQNNGQNALSKNTHTDMDLFSRMTTMARLSSTFWFQSMAIAMVKQSTCVWAVLHWCQRAINTTNKNRTETNFQGCRVQLTILLHKHVKHVKWNLPSNWPIVTHPFLPQLGWYVCCHNIFIPVSLFQKLFKLRNIFHIISSFACWY